MFAVVRGFTEGKSEIKLESSSVEYSCRPGELVEFSCMVSMVFPEIDQNVMFLSKASTDMAVCRAMFDDIRGDNPVAVDGSISR